MKQIQKTNPKDKDRTLLKGELEAMLRLKPHPNIVQLIDVYTLGNKIHIIMEYCGTNLKKYIHKKDNYPTWFQKLDIARQIAVGVKFLHSGKPQVIHRDLKPENVLLNVDGDTLQVKIADFGLTKINEAIDTDPDAEQNDQASAPVMTTAGGRGTPAFLAPELIKKNPYDSKVDIFAMGMTLLFLFFCEDNRYGK